MILPPATRRAIGAALAACALAAHAEGAAPAAPAAASAAPAASAPADAPQFVRTLGGISEYRLPDGLQVLLFPDDSQSTTVVNVTYRVGSRFESEGEYGMAHLLEHLQFRGTPTHPDLPAEFAAHGARFNGSTTEDRTNYFESFNADPATLAWALSMEADRMTHSFIRKSDLDKEMTVVRNEYERGENEPFAVLMKRVQSAAYSWHDYGHATIGPKSDIENVPIPNLQAFYHRFYRPDNATLLVAGKFDPAATLAQVARDFAPVARPATPIPAPWTKEPPQDGERSVEVRRVGGQPIILAYWHVPAAAHPDTAALAVYEELMSLHPAGRLYQDLVKTRQATAAGMFGLGGHDPRGAMAYAMVPPGGDVAKVEKTLLDDVEGRAPVRFDATQLERVKALVANEYRDAMKSPQGLIQQISDTLGDGDWRLLFQILDDVSHVTLADVDRVRAAYFRPANRTLGRYLPADKVERVAIPDAPPLAQRLAALKPPAVEAGEVFVPTTQALAARTTTRVLPSGIRLAEIHKRTRGNTVTLMMQLHWGTAEATTPRRGTDLVGAMLAEGSRTRSKQAIQDALIKLRAPLQVEGGNQEGTIYLRAERDTLLQALAVVADMVEHPVFPADAFARMKQQQVAALEAGKDSLSTLLGDALAPHANAARHVRFGDPDYRPTNAEVLAETKATTLADVTSFYREYWSANDAEVAVVGDVPPGVGQAVERLFGSWRKPHAPAFVQWHERHVDIPAARFDVQATDKTSAEALMSEHFKLREQDPDYAAMRVATYILGGGAMESRLGTRVRRQEGLSYGIGAGLHTDWWGDDASLVIDGTFAPQNRERVLAAVRDELAVFTRDGPTAAEVDRAKHDLLEGNLRGRADDGNLAGAELFHLREGKDWAWEGAKDAAIAAVTPAQVLAAWRAHVRADGFVVATAGDYAHVAQAAAQPAPAASAGTAASAAAPAGAAPATAATRH